MLLLKLFKRIFHILNSLLHYLKLFILLLSYCKCFFVWLLWISGSIQLRVFCSETCLTCFPLFGINWRNFFLGRRCSFWWLLGLWCLNFHKYRLRFGYWHYRFLYFLRFFNFYYLFPLVSIYNKEMIMNN